VDQLQHASRAIVTDDRFHDPAYRQMVDEVADNRLAFAEHLIERGDVEGAREELDVAEADLDETPDCWELRRELSGWAGRIF
jgi:hypothetical protein